MVSVDVKHHVYLYIYIYNVTVLKQITKRYFCRERESLNCQALRDASEPGTCRVARIQTRQQLAARGGEQDTGTGLGLARL